jgi:transposase
MTKKPAQEKLIPFKDRIIKYYKRGYTVDEIIHKIDLNVSTKTVIAFLRSYGVEIRPTGKIKRCTVKPAPKPPTKRKNIMINSAKDEIIKMHRKGCSHGEIAEAYDVHKHTIYQNLKEWDVI